MPIDMSKVDLDAPAFSEEPVTTDATPDASQAKSGEEDNKGQAPSDAASDEEQRIPYSRLKSAIDQRREAERRAEDAENRYQEMLRVGGDRREETRSTDLPSWWVKMYGDTEQSREGFTYWQQGQNEIREEARREALDAVRQQNFEETRAFEANERTIDEKLEDLSAGLGRELTKTEEGAILDIMDEFTPVDETGHYAGDLMPVEKAWEVYEMRQSKVSRKAQDSRRTPTELTSDRSDGETSTRNEKANQEFDPLDWGAWRRRV